MASVKFKSERHKGLTLETNKDGSVYLSDGKRRTEDYSSRHLLQRRHDQDRLKWQGETKTGGSSKTKANEGDSGD